MESGEQPGTSSSNSRRLGLYGGTAPLPALLYRERAKHYVVKTRASKAFRERDRVPVIPL